MENKIIKIAVLDDHQIVIDGLKLLLNDRKDIQVVGEENDALQMIKFLKQQTVDIVVSDILMPKKIEGITFCRLIKEELPSQQILVLSMDDNPKDIALLIDTIKVNGFVSKEAGKKELIEAIYQIYNGGTYYSQSILNILNNYKISLAKNQHIQLTVREKEIIECMLKYYSNKQIAEELYISERTVETHRKNIYRKTNTKGEASLFDFLKSNNLI
jgi:two-component system, NarL family, nitrate/nitrite response regulator NarL